MLDIFFGDLKLKSSNSNDYDNLSIFNFNNIINYIYDNYIQIILLICIFLIIYVVDRINQYNNNLFSMPQIPGLNTVQQQPNNIVKNMVKLNKKKKKN